MSQNPLLIVWELNHERNKINNFNLEVIIFESISQTLESSKQPNNCSDYNYPWHSDLVSIELKDA
jgi:hypothetical protein